MVQDLASAPLIRAEDENEKDMLRSTGWEWMVPAWFEIRVGHSWPKNVGFILIFMPKLIFLDDEMRNEGCGILFS